ncbi:MAG: sodium:proton antiporter [Clostridia bacterium]|nr:sodium:proton antiporter [Clostridia bacterium]
MTVDIAYEWLFRVALTVLGVSLFFSLFRCIRGPRIADRIVAVNMAGTQTTIIIAILTVMLKEGYLADVALIYTMLSFLAVVLLTKVYMGVYRERRSDGEKGDGTDA